MSKIVGILIDVDDGTYRVKQVEDSLESYYKILKCDTIDIVTRKLHGKVFDIVCDDEALLKDRPKVSAFDSNLNRHLHGNLFITGTADAEGRLTSLTKEDIRHIRAHCMTELDFIGSNRRTVLLYVGMP